MSATLVDLRLISHTSPDQSMRHDSTFIHRLTATREAIATIVSVRRPRRTTKKRRRAATAKRQRRPTPVPKGRSPRPIETLTNQHIGSRVCSFQGSAIYLLGPHGFYRVLGEEKGIVARLIWEAGREKPAAWNFTVREGIGFVTPRQVAPGAKK